MKNLDTLKTKRNDLLQQRADALDHATKAYESGDMTGYDADMERVKGFNSQLDTVTGLIAEAEKDFGGGSSGEPGTGEIRSAKSGAALVNAIRGTEKYADAWLEAVRKGITPDKGVGIPSLTPLYDAERAAKSMTIGGGSPAGEDGGFLVPVDFDNAVNEIIKDYIDLSALVTVENVNTNSGWRVVDTTGTRTQLTKVAEMGEIRETQKPNFKQVFYNCAKYADKVIVSNELMSDAKGLMAYLAGWWAPKYVLTKNALILEKLNALSFAAISGTTDAAQIKALKTLVNTGLNTAHSKRSTILTNAFGYDVMDNWVDSSGKALLVPDLQSDFSRFKGRPVKYADADLVPDVTVSEVTYHPFYIGDFKAFCTLFLRQGVRIRSTDIGGKAWDTDSTEIRCTCRMDCQSIDTSAVKYTGIKAAE